MRALIVAVVLSLLASVATAEEAYFLKIEFVGYDREKQRPEQDSVISSIELLVQPGQQFHIESTKADWSTLAKGRLNKKAKGTYVLEIAYERKSSSRGQMKSQTTMTLSEGEPRVLGGIYTTLEGEEKPFSKEAVRVTVQRREGNNTVDARPLRVPQKMIKIVPVRSPDPMNIEKGMIFDALEHELRFKKTIRDKRNLPTTIERGVVEPAPRIRELLRDQPRK
jgi:hypothetical protein